MRGVEDAYIKSVSLAQSSFGPILAVGGEKTVTTDGVTKTVKVTTGTTGASAVPAVGSATTSAVS